MCFVISLSLFAFVFSTIHSGKKVVLFAEIDRMKIFYHSPTQLVKCVSEYIFLIAKNKQAGKKQCKKVKETK